MVQVGVRFSHRVRILNIRIMNHYQKAIKYVRENRTWSDAQEQVALERINLYRCDISFAYPEIADEINDLMEEYGQDNDLNEGWWLEYGNVDDIFFAL